MDSKADAPNEAEMNGSRQRISSSIDYDERDFVTSTQENVYSEKKHVGNYIESGVSQSISLYGGGVITHNGGDHQRETSINRVKRMTP